MRLNADDIKVKEKEKDASIDASFRLSKKSRKVWAFSAFYGIISLGDEI